MIKWPRAELNELRKYLSEQEELDSKKWTDRGEGLISKNVLFKHVLFQIERLCKIDFSEEDT